MGKDTLFIPLTFIKNIMKFGDKTYIMGIINVNSDSFYEGSRCPSLAEAVEKAKKMIGEGVDIIDVGAESTRPGSSYLEPNLETERIIPVIKALSKLGVKISVDTYKSSVARKALEAGACFINDVSGGKYDSRMLPLAAEFNVPIILMHNPLKKGELPHVSKDYLPYSDVVGEVVEDLKRISEKAVSSGISPENIILDPGIGFRKSTEDNILLIRNLALIKELGFPVLVGASNKRFIGEILGIEDASKRLEGTLAVTTLSIMQGADIIRVHEVAPNVKVARMTDEIVRKRL